MSDVGASSPLPARPGTAWLPWMLALALSILALAIPWAQVAADGQPLIFEYSLQGKEFFLQNTLFLLMALWAVVHALRPAAPLWIPAALWAFGAFLAMGVLPLLFAGERATNPGEVWDTLQRTSALGLALFLGVQALNVPARLRLALVAVSISGALVATVGLLQYLCWRALGRAGGETAKLEGFAGAFVDFWQGHFGPITGPEALHPFEQFPAMFAVTFLAATFVSMTMIATGALLVSEARCGMRLQLTAALLLQGLYVGLSRTRTAWLALAAGGMAALFLFWSHWRRRRTAIRCEERALPPVPARSGDHTAPSAMSGALRWVLTGAMLPVGGLSGVLAIAIVMLVWFPPGAARLKRLLTPMALFSAGLLVLAGLIAADLRELSARDVLLDDARAPHAAEIQALTLGALGSVLADSTAGDGAALRADPFKATISRTLASIVARGGDKGRVKRLRESLSMMAINPGVEREQPVVEWPITLVPEAAGLAPLLLPQARRAITRGDLWPLAEEFPALGYGPGHWKYHYPRFVSLEWEANVPRNFTVRQQPSRLHCEPLEIFCESGVPGIIAYLAFWALVIVAWRRAWRRASDDVERAAAAAALIAAVLWWVHGSFNFPREFAASTLVLAMLIAPTLVAGRGLAGVRGADGEAAPGAGNTGPSARWWRLLPAIAVAVTGFALRARNDQLRTLEQHVLSGRLAYQDEDYVAASEHFRRALAIDGSHLRSLLLLADSLVERSGVNSDIPDRLIEHALTLNPWSIQALTLKGRIFAQRLKSPEHYETASQALRAALEVHEQNYQALLATGDLMLRYERPREAEHFYTEALKNDPAIIQGPAGRGAPLEGRGALARLGALAEQYGRQAGQREDHAGARAFFRRALDYYRFCLPPPELALVSANLAEALDDVPATLDMLRRTRRDYPGDARLAFKEAELRVQHAPVDAEGLWTFSDAEYEALIADFALAVDRLSDSALAAPAREYTRSLEIERHTRRAEIALARDDGLAFDDAVAHLATLGPPALWKIEYLRALRARRLGQELTAIDHERKALAAIDARTTLSGPSQRRRARLEQALSLWSLDEGRRKLADGLPEAAFIEFSEGVKLRPTWWKLWEGRARAAELCDRDDEALLSYEKLFACLKYDEISAEYARALADKALALSEKAPDYDAGALHHGIAQWHFQRGITLVEEAWKLTRAAGNDQDRALARATFVAAKEHLDLPELRWGIQGYQQKFHLIDCEFALGGDNPDQVVNRARDQMFSAQTLSGAPDHPDARRAWDHFSTLEARYRRSLPGAGD